MSDLDVSNCIDEIHRQISKQAHKCKGQGSTKPSARHETAPCADPFGATDTPREPSCRVMMM